MTLKNVWRTILIGLFALFLVGCRTGSTSEDLHEQVLIDEVEKDIVVTAIPTWTPTNTPIVIYIPTPTPEPYTPTPQSVETTSQENVKVISQENIDQVINLGLLGGGEISDQTEVQLSVTKLVFSTDGTMLASTTGFREYFTRLWRVSDGALLLTWDDVYPNVRSVSFSPDGTTFAWGSISDILLNNSATVELWWMDFGELFRLKEIYPDEHYNHPFDAIGMMSFNDERGGQLHKLEGHTGDVSGLAFSADGATLASADSTIRLWRVEDGVELRTLEGGPGELVFSPDGMILASIAQDTVNMWRLSDGELVFSHDFLGSSSVALSSDWSKLAVGDPGFLLDSDITVWNVNDIPPLGGYEDLGLYGYMELKGYKGDINSLAFSPDGTALTFGIEDGAVWLLFLDSWELYSISEAHITAVTSTTFSPDGTRLSSGSRDGTVLLWGIP